MRSRVSWIAAIMLPWICSPLLAQSGTFSGSAVAGLGTGRSAIEEEEPILTKDTIGAWLETQVSQLTYRLRAAKAGSVNPRAATSNVKWIEKSKRYQFRSKADRDMEVKRLEAEILAPTLPGLHPFALRTDQIGSFVDPTERIGLRRGNGLAVAFHYQVLQIIDKDTAIINVAGRDRDTRFFLVSPIVGGLQEGQSRKKLPGAFIVEGTRQYTTAIGAASTIPVLKEYDLGPELKKAVENSTKKRVR